MNNHPAFSRPNDEPLLPRTNPNQSISRPPCCVSTSNLWRYGFQLTIQMMILTCFFNKHAIDYASSVSDFFSASPLYINWLANDQVFDPNLSHYPYPTGNWSSLVPDSCTHTWKQFRLQHRLEDSNLLACQNTSFDRFFNSIQHTKTQLRPQFWNMIFLTAASIVLTTLYTCRCAPQKLLQLILNFFTVTMCFSPPILKHINRYRELLCKSQIPAPCSLQPFSEHHVITDYNDIPGYSALPRFSASTHLHGKLPDRYFNCCRSQQHHLLYTNLCSI